MHSRPSTQGGRFVFPASQPPLDLKNLRRRRTIMARRLTGFTPSGDLHLGNLIGAIGPIVDAQRHAADPADTVIFVSDLHALTLEHDPDTVRRRTLEFAKLLLAAGTDPDRCLFLVQSHVPQHTEIHYLLECVTGYGEAQRMIQFKEKSAKTCSSSPRATPGPSAARRPAG
jgi:tryptophanyl-tRNA synthetase